MEKFVNNFKKWTGIKTRNQPREPSQISRCDYSMVSCTEVTPGALELWLELPEEVRYDPALAPFKRIYENEIDNNGSVKVRKEEPPRKQRLPAVNSAPHLNQSPIQNGGSNNVGGFVLPGTSADVYSIPEQAEAEAEKPKSRIDRAGHYLKVTLLLGCWMFFTIIFMMYNEKEEVIRHSFITPGDTKNYIIDDSADNLTLLVKLQGPFLSYNQEQILNSTEFKNAHKIEIWMERWLDPNITNVTQSKHHHHHRISPIWQVILLDEEDIDFSEAEKRSTVLKFNLNVNNKSALVYSDAKYIGPMYNMVRLRTTVKQITPFTLSYTKNPLDASTGVIFSCILLCGLYILIIFEIVNRTIAAVIISTTSLAVLSMIGERPSIGELITWLDIETLLLLFSMMVLVAIMAETGMFDYLAVFTFQVTKGKMWPLINLLSFITALLSTVLDNVTTVLLMTPVTIRLCEVMELDPVPILMCMVLYSNIGGTATPVGDPPNVIIASNKDVVNAGINFTNFTLHMSVGVIFVCVQTYFQLRFIYRDTSSLRLNVPRDIQELRHQISIWRRAEASLPHFSNDQEIVRQALEKKIRKLNSQLDLKLYENTTRACPKDTFKTTLAELKKKYKIRDKNLLVKTSIAIAFVVAVFFLHSIPELNRVSLGWTAFLGAVLLLILADREDLEPILHRVEWSTLIFFAALFILMEALSKLGLIEWIGGLTEGVILSVDESARLAVALILMLWVSGVTSAFVDNIPLTTMMVRVVVSLGANPMLNLPIEPLIWALAYGACMGGNGTLIGASANVVCAGVAEQHGYKMSFNQFFKVGFPVMLGHLVIASIYLLICHCVLTWH